MQFERFDLLARVVEGHARAQYDLSSSDMPATRLAECGGLADLSLAESHVGGSEELRSELARIYGGRSEEYIVTAGASEANFAVFAALLSPGDRVLVEQPTYQPLEAIPRGLGATVIPLVRTEASGFQLPVDAVRTTLPQGLRMLTVTNLNNPTGAALDPSEVRALADLAAEHGFFLFVDETFRELAFDRETPTVGGLNERTVVTSTLSKFYGAGGLRIGWVRAAAPVLARIQAVLDYLSATPAGPSESIALEVLKNRGRTLSRNRGLIEEGRRVFREWAAPEPELTWTEPVAHLTFPGVGGDTVRLADVLLQKYGTFIAPGESFGVPGHFRLNIGIGAEKLEEGLRRVSKARSQLKSPS
jgi:aspartate/methionine/tyrosine aminotransferase